MATKKAPKPPVVAKVEVEEVVARPLPPNQQAALDRWLGKKEKKDA